MSNVDKIRKIHIIVCWVYIFLSFRAIINDTEYFLLIFLAFIYSIVSLPLYSVKNKIVSICLAINSILLMSFPILINKFFPESFLTYTVLISVFILELAIFHLIRKDFDIKLTNEYKKISQFRSKVSQSPWIKYLEISSFILTIFPSILYGTVDNHVLTLIFLIKICADTTIKFLFIRLFDTSTLMKRRIFFLFALDVIVYLFLGYLLVIQKAGYLFSVLLLFSNFSVPFIKEKEFELFKNSK
ncbi:hypothetical protein RK278_04120 [Streptococcus pneumoniae]|uniref:Uncharacterized protein n=7 Tax=Streptococcus pneumoniae TaxID=1313 RepID=A0A4J2FCX5_STREE|nr:hypothetical protein [Streptococcus pneumoniae]EOB31895.1 hypothetical protein D060_08425 [Streptococcus pneumoniae 845]MDS2229913.1 hypothetical protein [Streptococcus pneumoniae]MDS2388693.1 hypothetical protein [Streptococcus pneumoniae]MDS2397272.1 hypothetical protein [Streptococcus pneumoniae]MDS2434317.1 hypothetical protein [Streptococcus pneumoniae]